MRIPIATLLAGTLLVTAGPAFPQSIGQVLRTARDAVRQAERQARRVGLEMPTPVRRMDDSDVPGHSTHPGADGTMQSRSLQEPDEQNLIPPQIRGLRQLLDDRRYVANYRELRCREASERAARARVPGERRSAERDSCIVEARAHFVALHALVRDRARSWVAAQPVSYDGLRSLRNARLTYAETFSATHRDEDTDATRVLAEQLIKTRAEEIETVLRPQIIEDMNRTGDTNLVSGLFVADGGLRQNQYAPYIFDPKLVERLPPRTGGRRPFYQREGEVSRSTREQNDAARFARLRTH